VGGAGGAANVGQATPNSNAKYSLNPNILILLFIIIGRFIDLHVLFNSSLKAAIFNPNIIHKSTMDKRFQA
jgi:hypothetical protein